MLIRYLRILWRVWMRILGLDELVRTFLGRSGSRVLTERYYSGSAAESHTGGAVHCLRSFPNWAAVVLYTSGFVPSSYEGMRSYIQCPGWNERDLRRR